VRLRAFSRSSASCALWRSSMARVRFSKFAASRRQPRHWGKTAARAALFSLSTRASSYVDMKITDTVVVAPDLLVIRLDRRQADRPTRGLDPSILPGAKQQQLVFAIGMVE